MSASTRQRRLRHMVPERASFWERQTLVGGLLRLRSPYELCRTGSMNSHMRRRRDQSYIRGRPLDHRLCPTERTDRSGTPILPPWHYRELREFLANQIIERTHRNLISFCYRRTAGGDRTPSIRRTTVRSSSQSSLGPTGQRSPCSITEPPPSPYTRCTLLPTHRCAFSS